MAKKYNRAQLLAKILEPSKAINPQFAAYMVRTTSGKSYVGILVSKTNKEVVLRDAEDKQIHIPAGDVEQMAKQSRSLMPRPIAPRSDGPTSRGFAKLFGVAEVAGMLRMP